MELGSPGPLNAVRRPYPAILLEVLGLLRVPIPGGKDRRARRAEFSDRLVQGRNHFVTVRDGERSTRTKVILDINDDQCIAFGINHGTLLALTPIATSEGQR